MQSFTFICLAILAAAAFAKPPPPPKGKKWVLVRHLSDEFNGNRLDTKKWRNGFVRTTNPSRPWDGPKPVKFEKNAISIKNGKLRITAAPLPKATKDGRTIRTGSVQSLKPNAHFGYYEAKFKISPLMLSTTFWLANYMQPLPKKLCAKGHFGQELDISEQMGRAGKGWSREVWANNMVSHAPYWEYTRNCGGSSNGVVLLKPKHEWKIPLRLNGTGKMVKAYDTFNTYGCWWKNGNEATFYSNDKKGESIKFKTTRFNPTKTYNNPMFLNFLMGAYYEPGFGRPLPTNAELKNPRLNFAEYDWVRSWKLVKA